LTAQGLKPVENRTWSTRYRGPLLIHAALRRDAISDDDFLRRFGMQPPSDQPLGGIIGIVDLVDVVRDHPSQWYLAGHFGFVLANPRPLPFVKWRGALMLRDAPAELLAQLPDLHSVAA